MQPIALRTLTDGEATALEHLAHSRTAPARAVERARIIWAVHQGEGVRATATARGVDPETVRRWLKRFNTRGLAGLEDRPRCGRKPTYSPAQVVSQRRTGSGRRGRVSRTGVSATRRVA